VQQRQSKALPGSSPLVTTPSYSTLYAMSCRRVVRDGGQGQVHDGHDNGQR